MGLGYSGDDESQAEETETAAGLVDMLKSYSTPDISPDISIDNFNGNDNNSSTEIEYDEYTNKALQEAAKAALRAKRHDNRWQEILGMMLVEGSLSDAGDWGERDLEDFVKVVTDYVVATLSLQLAEFERQREIRELGKVGRRLRRESCSF